MQLLVNVNDSEFACFNLVSCITYSLCGLRVVSCLMSVEPSLGYVQTLEI
uniref:Uncharacterized protein n=1 Tax=Arundo donax TaxID=35708 RepID=A0A0A8YRV8_ARUDO